MLLGTEMDDSVQRENFESAVLNLRDQFVVIVIIIIIIIGKTAPFEPEASLEDPVRFTIRFSLLWISQQ
jgi:hypothetical protein